MDFSQLADQAERVANDAPDERFAASWRQIAKGFRELERLRAGFAQPEWWRDREHRIGH